MNQTNPASTKVVIYEVISRPGYELTTDARVDDFPYVGSKAWRAVLALKRELMSRKEMKRPRR